MPIDWFTVAAQILNFLVLIWILKRFLYQPVLRVIAERQASVQKSLDDAASLKEQATTELAKLENERKTLDQERDSAMREARADADAERQRLTDEARAEFEAARKRWRGALDREQAEFQRELSEQAHTEVIAIADKLLRDLADTDLQERILEKFLQMIAGLDEDAKAALQKAGMDSGAATVRSAFELPPDRREAVESATRGILGKEAAIEFETKPSLGCGIELSADGHKIAWTLDDYLRSLDTWVRELVARQLREPDRS
jgi:F-type H+-transporting ATPase subunit b